MHEIRFGHIFRGSRRARPHPRFEYFQGRQAVPDSFTQLLQYCEFSSEILRRSTGEKLLSGSGTSRLPWDFPNPRLNVALTFEFP
eukprot:3495030-Rhodomonas_salina.1